MIINLTDDIIQRSSVVFYGAPGRDTSDNISYSSTIYFKQGEQWYQTFWRINESKGKEIQIRWIDKKTKKPSRFKKIKIPVVFQSNEAKIRAIAICPVLTSIGVA